MNLFHHESIMELNFNYTYQEMIHESVVVYQSITQMILRDHIKEKPGRRW
jgi:hypothetical protein